MYSKESRAIYTLLFFFSVGTADEILSLLQYPNDITGVIYLGMIIYAIINYNRFVEGKYLWDGAFPIIGLFALMELFSGFFNFYTSFFMKMDSVVSIAVWVRCVQHLNEYKNTKHEDDESIEEI